MKYHQLATQLCWIAAAIGATACVDELSQPAKTLTAPAELLAALEPSAAEALGPGGLFATNKIDPAFGPQIPEQEARRLAETFGRAYAIHARNAFEEERGGRIEFESLTACGRSMYASSPYVSDPAQGNAEQNLFGPKWIVTLCGSGMPQLSIAVAALATYLRVNGPLIQFPPQSGNEFFPRGIPASWRGGLAVDPEQAAILGAKATGSRVSTAPKLMLVGAGWIPQAAQWLIGTSPKGGSPEMTFVGLRLDGRPAVGAAAVVAQRPSADVSLALGASQLAINGYTNRPMPGFQFGWKTMFTPIGGK